MKLTSLHKQSSNQPIALKEDSSNYREIHSMDVSIQDALVLGRSIRSSSLLVQNKNNKKYYIKRIINLTNNSKSLPQIEKELSIYTQLHHENILQIISQKHREHECLYEIIIPFLEKGTLSNVISKKKRLQEEEACLYFLQIVKAVEYLNNKKGIILRNLNTDVIYIDNNDKVYICDFSNSIRIQKGKNSFKFYDRNEDLFNLGVVLYAMTHGDINVQNDSLYKVDINKVSKECADLIKKLLDINNIIKSVDNIHNDITFKKIYEHAWMKKNNLSTYREQVLQIYEKEQIANGYGNERSKDMNEIKMNKMHNEFLSPLDNEEVNFDEPSFTADSKNADHLLNSKIVNQLDSEANLPFNDHKNVNDLNNLVDNKKVNKRHSVNTLNNNNNIYTKVNRTAIAFNNKNNSIFDSDLFDNTSLRILMEAKKDKAPVPMLKMVEKKKEVDKRPKLINPKKSFFDYFKFG